jgi:signal transduction histidine kinase
MKSFATYQRLNTYIAILIFLLGSIAFYGVLQYVLLRQLDDSLKAEKQEISDYVQKYHQLPVIQNTKNQWVIIDSNAHTFANQKFRTIKLYNTIEQEMQEVRQLSFALAINNQQYFVQVNKLQAETEDLLQLIAILAFSMIALLLVLNYFVNRKLVNKLFKPFQKTISAIQAYKIGQNAPLQLPESSLAEMHLLNTSLNEMSQRIYVEYRSLKSFTENAAHEMQTPLAVMRSLIESIIQQNN